MTYFVSITAHSDTATGDEVVAAAQAALDSLPGALNASVSGTAADGFVSRSLSPTPAPEAVDDPVVDDETATDEADDSAAG